VWKGCSVQANHTGHSFISVSGQPVLATTPFLLASPPPYCDCSRQSPRAKTCPRRRAEVRGEAAAEPLKWETAMPEPANGTSQAERNIVSGHYRAGRRSRCAAGDRKPGRRPTEFILLTGQSYLQEVET
jgi:hypothetical protein